MNTVYTVFFTQNSSNKEEYVVVDGYSAHQAQMIAKSMVGNHIKITHVVDEKYA